MAGPVVITSLEESIGTTFTLNCISAGSPASNVTWMKDGDVIAVNNTFEMVQILQDGVTAEYNNLLKVYLEPSDVLGNYTCVVENSVSEPAIQSLPVEGNDLVLLGITLLFTAIINFCRINTCWNHNHHSWSECDHHLCE